MSLLGTKVTLTKKSGPGELIGVVEKVIGADNVLTFTGLQFSEPGDYVIAVKSDNTSEIEDTEFSVKVEPQAEIIPQESPKDNADPKKETSGERPCIAQIDQPTYKLPPMVLKKTDGTQATLETTSTLGINPFFYYNGIQMDVADLKSMNLYNDGLFPKITLEFKDSKDVLKKYPPLDDTRFEIFLNSQSTNIKSLHLRFKYESHKALSRNQYSIVGTLDIPMLYTVSSKSYKGTSFEVLREMAKEMELGYNSNIQNTDDSMNWINTNKKIMDFIKEIVAHSYISDDSFMIAYFDYYYSLNFVDVEKEWKRDISQDKGIDGNAANRIQSTLKEEDRVMSLRLSNEKALVKTSSFISEFTFTNNSTYQSLRKGYSTDVKYYDPKSKSFLEFKVDSLTHDDKNNKSLKGQPGDKKYFEENYRTEFKGKIDDDNVHKNYNYASTQNRINLDNLVKIQCDLTLPTPNFNLYKFQKIKIIFVNDSKTPIADETSMQRYTGEWQIIDISYIWKAGKFSQKIKAVRRELSKTNEEKKNETPETKPETKESPQPNPTPPEQTSKANSEFNFGEVYTVIDRSGNFYEILITDILTNGKEVTGVLKVLQLAPVPITPP